jgi:pimeloyl-ACP methyl ester carboxylesterase
MPPSSRLEPFVLPLTVDGTHLVVSGVHRPGTGTPLVFLHGFGSTKEDYADVRQQSLLHDRPVLAYDAPGCGGTTCSDLEAISVRLQVKVAQQVLQHWNLHRYHLIGHSMGGLTALLLAHQNPSQVASFVDIEGNLRPEDCFLSRQIVSHSHRDADAFLADFVDRLTASRYYSSSLYAASLPHKVRAGAVRPIFESMVEITDTEPLLDWLLDLSAPTMFMYGEQNNALSYLPMLQRGGVELAEVVQSGHFPMYSNAPEMWRRIADFVIRVESGVRSGSHNCAAQ